jgi:hypothetical protein
MEVVPPLVGVTDVELTPLAVAVGAVELTPMQTARVSVTLRLAYTPVSQSDPTHGFHIVSWLAVMLASEAMSKQRRTRGFVSECSHDLAKGNEAIE